MEDYEAQEIEFWAKLEEEGMSRSSMLRRSAAAAFGLTIVGSASTALGATKAARAPPTRMTKGGLAGARQGREEGRPSQHDRPAARLGELRGGAPQLPAKYGIGITNDNPDGTSAQENEAIRSLKGDKRAPDAVDVTIPFAISGANEGLYAKYFNTNYKTIPRALKDTRGFWMGDYWGAVSIGYNKSLISNPPEDVQGPAEARVQRQGRYQRVAAHFGVGHRRRLRKRARERRVAQRRHSRNRLLVEDEEERELHPRRTTPQTVASGQTPISLDWDYNNLAYVKEFPAAKLGFNVPSDGVYGGYYAQAISATAPHPYAARLWDEYLYSDQGQIIWLKGGAHPARFADMVARKVIPQSVLASLPAAAIYTKVKFASLGQQTKAKALIAQQWPTKVGG